MFKYIYICPLMVNYNGSISTTNLSSILIKVLQKEAYSFSLVAPMKVVKMSLSQVDSVPEIPMILFVVIVK